MIDHVSIGVRDIARTKRFTTRHSSRSVTNVSAKAKDRWAMARTQLRSGCPAQMAGARRPEIGSAFLLCRADAAQHRGIPRGGIEQWRARQRRAWPARGLQSRLLCGLCHRSRRLSARGALQPFRGVIRGTSDLASKSEGPACAGPSMLTPLRSIRRYS